MTRKVTSELIAKSSSTLIEKTVTKAVTSPYFLAADVAELTVRTIAKDKPIVAQVAGTAVGIAGYVSIGAIIGGSVGATIGGSVYIG